MANAFVREGGGQFDPSGRYYFHGDNNSSGAELHKFDMVGDKFTEVAKTTGGNNGGYGSRNVVVTANGQRVFWASRMYGTSDLRPIWTINDEIYSASNDGRFAIGTSKVYDTALNQTVYGLPTNSGKVSAVNSMTNKLVLQNGARISYYRLGADEPAAAPVLKAPTTVQSSSIKLEWTVSGLQIGFTLQMRVFGTEQWTDVSTTIAASDTSYSVGNLNAGTTYEFRIRANSPAGGSSWSNVVQANTSPGLPSISRQPTSQVVAVGSSVVFTVGLTTTIGTQYQWYKDGQPISGASADTLSIGPVSDEDAGVYTVKITNGVGSVTSAAATLAIGNGRMGNFSIRSNSGTGDQVLIVGFSTRGGNKQLLLRGIGPGLAGFGLAAPHPNPSMELYSGTRLINSNDNWSASVGGTQIASIAAQLNAFSLAYGSLDAALYATLSEGAYTIQIKGEQNTTGIVLAEIYDANQSVSSKLVNVSARTKVEAGEGALIGGFVISGTGKRSVLIRAVGPSLSRYGVTGVLANPHLSIFKGSTLLIASNDDWDNSSAMVSTFNKVGAFALDAASKDSVLLLNLDAGSYSGVVTGVGGGVGIALLEIYEVQ